MKYESFDGRWDGEELSALLARDGIDITIRFITESDYKIRVYYEGKVITYSSSNYLTDHWSQQQHQQQQQQQPPYTNPHQTSGTYIPLTSGSGNMVMSTPFADRIRQIFGDRQ